jgi:hypothetical protein
MEISMEVPQEKKKKKEKTQKLKTEVPYNAAILLLDIHLKESKSASIRDKCNPCYCHTSHNNQVMEST